MEYLVVTYAQLETFTVIQLLFHKHTILLHKSPFLNIRRAINSGFLNYYIFL